MLNLDFLKKKKKFKKHGDQPDPRIYWMIVFFVGFILTICAFVFGFYTFAGVNQEDLVLPTPPNKQLEKISKDRINKILSVFSEREENTNKILNEGVKVVDPSL